MDKIDELVKWRGLGGICEAEEVGLSSLYSRLKEGDVNSRYFHMVANDCRRFNLVSEMQIGDASFKDDSNIISETSSYVKNQFQLASWELGLKQNLGLDMDAPFSIEEIESCFWVQ